MPVVPSSAPDPGSPPSEASPPGVTTGQVARNTLLNYAGSVFNLLNGVAISIVLARSLGPERLGVYSGLSFTVALTNAIFSFGLGATIIKTLSEYGARLEAEAVTRVVRLFAFGVFLPAACSALAVAGALAVANRDHRYGLGLVLLGAASAIPAYVAQIYRALVNGFQEFGFLLRVNLTAAVLLLVSTLSMALTLRSVGGYLAAAILPNLFVIAATCLHYRRYLFGRVPPASLPRKQLREIMSYLWPVALISILDMIVWQYSEVLFLNAFRPAREVAFYSVAFSLASLLLRGVASSVTAGFMPALSQLYGAGDHARIRTAFYAALRLSVVFTVPLMAMVAMVGRPVVLLFYGASYSPAARYIAPLVVAAGLGTIASVAADTMYSTRQQHSMLRIALAVAVLNVGLDLALIPAHGISGAVIANVAAQAAAAIGTLLLSFSRYGEHPPLRSYFGPLAAAGLILACAWPLANYLHGSLAIVAVGAVGLPSYLVGIRIFRVLSSSDSRLLASMADHVPEPHVRRAIQRVLAFCVPGVERP